MSKVLDYKGENINQILENNIVLIMFGSPSCGNCKIMKMKLGVISPKYPQIDFVYWDVSTNGNPKDIVGEVEFFPCNVLISDGKHNHKLYGSNHIALEDYIKEQYDYFRRRQHTI